jgi:uncharacterized membrane protein
MSSPPIVADSVPPLLEAFGRLHPVMVHLPLGLVFAAFAVEGWRIVQRRREMSPFTPTALALAAIAGVMAGATGIAFAESHGSGDDLFWHRWLGIGATAACAAAAWAASRAARPGGADAVPSVRALIVGLAVLVAWSGHLGANMVWGSGFLWEPLVAKDEAGDPAADGDAAAPPGSEAGAASPAVAGAAAAAAAPDADPVRTEKLAFFRSNILPIFETRCYECHGNGKRKGGLRMDDRSSLVSKDDEGLWIVKPGAPEESVLIGRVLLPAEDDLAMPPEGERLAAAQVEDLRTWIEDGAVMPEPSDAAPQRAAPEAASAASRPRGSDAVAPRAAAPARRPLSQELPPLAGGELEAAAALRAKGINAMPMAAGASTLTVSMPGGAEVGDIDFVAIYPMAARIEELSLARSSVTDAGVMSMPSLPNARSVRLDNTGLTDVGITAVLSRTLDAEVVNLVNTPATDRSFTALGQLPFLRKVYLYGTKVTPDGVNAFRRARPGVEVNVGGSP